MPQRASRRVARIDENLLALRRLALVERLKIVTLHEHLTAHFEQFGVGIDLERNRTQRSQVLRHVLAHRAVATGGAPHKQTI